MNYCTIDDVTSLYRTLDTAETTKATALIPIASDQLRLEASHRGMDLDEMIAEDSTLASVAKSVTVNIVARALMTPTSGQPLSQFSESALGFSVSGTYLNPGQFVKPLPSELKELGIIRQRAGMINLCGDSNV